MVQIRPGDATRFLSKADPAVPVVLLHGSDEGLVAERAAAFTETVLGDADPSMNRVVLDSAAIAADPGLLADEANAVSMFGGRRIILVRLEGNRPIQKSVEAILAAPPSEAWIVILAGELRRGAGLRGLCEKHNHAAAIACYADDGRALDGIIDEETSAAKLSITDEARAALKALLGADRRISRSEIAKLCLYAAERDTITLDDINAVVGDAAAFAIDEAVDAAALGRIDAFDHAFRRLVQSGTPGVVIASAAQRHFDFLHRARAACDEGESADAVIGRARPPVFFRRRDNVKRQIATWPRTRIERGLEILDAAILDSRRNGAIADPVIAQALLRIATAAAGSGSRR